MIDCYFFDKGRVIHKHRLSFIPAEGHEVWIGSKIYVVVRVAVDLRRDDDEANNKINVWVKEMVEPADVD